MRRMASQTPLALSGDAFAVVLGALLGTLFVTAFFWDNKDKWRPSIRRRISRASEPKPEALTLARSGQGEVKRGVRVGSLVFGLASAVLLAGGILTDSPLRVSLGPPALATAAVAFALSWRFSRARDE